jgi:hypothetical protein
MGQHQPMLCQQLATELKAPSRLKKSHMKID